jgi:hypothetical protein
MTRNLFVSLFAAILIAGFQPAVASAAADIPGMDAEDSASASLDDAADQAGTAAGIVNQCHSDATPIQSAFLRALDQAKLDPAHRQSLWQRYRTAETSTLSTLANKAAISCIDTNGIIQNTIRELDGPHS